MRVIMLPKAKDVHSTRAEGHESYRELCALASSGALTEREWIRLSGHLKDCAECREELAKYQEIATFGMSLVSPSDACLDVENEWSPESAVAKLMNRLQEDPDDSYDVSHAARTGILRYWPPVSLSSRFLPYAAAILMCAAAATSLYVAGVRIGVYRTNSDPQRLAQPESTLAGLLQERTHLQSELQSRAATMESISQQLEDARKALDAAQAQKLAADANVSQLEQRIQTEQADDAAIRAQFQSMQNGRLAADLKLKQSEANLAAIQRDFDSLRDQHAADLTQIASLEGQIATVSRRSQPAAYVEEAQASSADPDLSALMGARDLLIADVYDIDKAGVPKKPFGRIFYTRGSRLLFYAFDLDRQPGVKKASTFQVWGRRGYGDTHPLNMGVMYLDSKLSNRWALKFDDAKELSQIDAVFVTIEPHGGSNKPSGRQLLYASLKTPANHP
ncbi:MAG: hypothetical protein ACRD3Q_16965 [Terriglobales bacterium]